MPENTPLSEAEARRIHRHGFERGVREGYEQARKNPNLPNPVGKYHLSYWYNYLFQRDAHLNKKEN